MILGDLLGADVYDDGGARLGRVADARFVVDGAPQQLMAGARLLGLVVSPHSASSFLGYERTPLSQPWPLPQMLRWRHRGSFLVLWEDIAGSERTPSGCGRSSPRIRRNWTVPGRSDGLLQVGQV